MFPAMQAAILDEQLRFDGKYIEYHVPGSLREGPPITILVKPPDSGSVAILFIPNAPGTPMPPDFLQNTVTLHWRTLGSHIRDFVFYAFDGRIGDPTKYVNHTISGLSGGRIGTLNQAQEYIRMFCDNYQSNEWIRGRSVDAAQDAEEMGCVEGDGFEMLKGLDMETRAKWMDRLKFDEKKTSYYPNIYMRAIFEKDLKEPVAFLPYIADPDGSVWIKPLWLDRKRRDWQHVRRVLFRSVHQRLPDKLLMLSCGIEDCEFRAFLSSYGYEDFECNYWSGEYC